MKIILTWKCGECNSEQTSYSDVRWSMQTCSCGKSAVDLEEHYQRGFGSIIEINRTVIGEVKSIEVKPEDEGISEGTNEGINVMSPEEIVEWIKDHYYNSSEDSDIT